MNELMEKIAEEAFMDELLKIAQDDDDTPKKYKSGDTVSVYKMPNNMSNPLFTTPPGDTIITKTHKNDPYGLIRAKHNARVSQPTEVKNTFKKGEGYDFFKNLSTKSIVIAKPGYREVVIIKK